MRNLIPKFIIEKFDENKFSGNFTAATMFIDISGFTKMTQDLMKNGKEGAEILSDIINEIYTPSIKSVYDYNGFITTFAGDAFTSVFPYKDSKPIFAVNAAHKIQEIFNKIGKQNTKFGKFELSVKIGLSYGNVSWGIIRSDKQNSYFFKGEAIDNCAKCEQKTSTGEAIFDQNLIQKVLKNIKFTEKTNKFYLLKSIKKTDVLIRQKRSLPKLSNSEFIPEKINKLKTKGEFRDIISCFISFEETKNWKQSISMVLELTNIYGGYFNKIDFGDKGGNILVLFGAPIGKEKIFKRACDFALTVKQLNLKDFKTRIGLTYGTVFSGFVDSKLRAEYTALGMVVNLSARFMMKAKWNEIYIDRFINKSIQNRYDINELSKQQFKGFKVKIPVYLLEKKKEYKTIFEGKLIGRQKELQKLKRILKLIQNNKFGGIVYIHGIAGIGKSRLVNELKEQVERSKGHEFNWFYLPCDEILRKSFNPFIYFLKNYFEQSEENTKQINKSNFERKLESIIKLTKDKEIKNELIRTKSILGAMINLFWKNSLYEQLDTRSRYENILYAVKNLIKAESLQKPVIIELEDGHWIESDSEKQLKVLTTNIEKYSIIIISACRLKDDGSQFNLGLKEVPQKNIVLEHLEKESSRKLVNDKLKGKVSEKLFNLIWQKSEGNPFYIEQMILYLQENELLDNNLNLFKEEITIPKSINSIIVSRIDRLTSELKELVQTASVLGREFTVNILAAMLKGKKIDKELTEGEQENIWNALTEINYIFKHALIRETVYEMQLKKNLRKLHKLAAETIENLYKEDLKPVFGELANHYEKAEMKDKEMEYLEKAGDYVRENYKNEQAIEFYDRLLKYNIDDELRIDTLRKKGDVLDLIGKWKDAENIFRDALNISKQIKDKKRIAKLSGDYGSQLRLKGDKEAIRYLNIQLKYNKELGNKEGISIALGNIGNYYLFQSNYQKAQEYYQHQLQVDEELNDNNGIATATLHIGLVYLDQGKYDSAQDCFQKSLLIFEEQQNKKGISMTLGNMGNLNYFQNNFQKALLYYKQLLDISSQIGNKNGISIALGNMGLIYNIRSDFKKALEYQKKRLTIDQELGNKSGIAIAYNNIGQIFMDQGTYNKALEYFNKSLKINVILENKEGISLVIGNIGGIYYYQGNYQKALDNFKKKLAISRELKNSKEISVSLLNIGTVFMDQGNFSEALDYFESCLEIRNEIKDTKGISSVYENLGILNHLQKKSKNANAYFDDAISISRKLNIKAELCNQLFLKAHLLYDLNDYGAKKLIDEALIIARELNVKDILFNCSILTKKISFRFSEEKQIKYQSINQLEKLLDDNVENQSAILNCELAIMYHKVDEKSKMEECKNKALKLMNKLYKKTPKIEYKNKINELENLK